MRLVLHVRVKLEPNAHMGLKLHERMVLEAVCTCENRSKCTCEIRAVFTFEMRASSACEICTVPVCTCEI